MAASQKEWKRMNGAFLGEWGMGMEWEKNFENGMGMAFP